MSYDKGMAEQERPSKILLHNSGNAIDTVAGIISFHRSKWLDVGYNWLIYEGKSFVGRPMKYVGAHSRGANDGTIGICMVGNWMRSLPPKESIDELVRMLIKQCFMFNIDPSEIVGHRDVGNTDCPGDALYAYLPEIREMVAEGLKKEVAKTKPKRKAAARKESKNV